MAEKSASHVLKFCLWMDFDQTWYKCEPTLYFVSQTKFLVGLGSSDFVTF